MITGFLSADAAAVHRDDLLREAARRRLARSVAARPAPRRRWWRLGRHAPVVVASVRPRTS
jgi:hypothetical protein